MNRTRCCIDPRVSAKVARIDRKPKLHKQLLSFEDLPLANCGTGFPYMHKAAIKESGSLPVHCETSLQGIHFVESARPDGLCPKTGHTGGQGSNIGHEHVHNRQLRAAMHHPQSSTDGCIFQKEIAIAIIPVHGNMAVKDAKGIPLAP